MFDFFFAFSSVALPDNNNKKNLFETLEWIRKIKTPIFLQKSGRGDLSSMIYCFPPFYSSLSHFYFYSCRRRRV